MSDEEQMGRKTLALVDVMRRTLQVAPRRILVVGCGSGLEAGLLAREFQAETYGIDLGQEFVFEYDKAAPAKLMTMDARHLAFEDASFDFVFSFHALEHIPGPERALSEMARVLGPHGAFMIGTPNRSRLLGYIGSAESLRDKIRWNLTDLGMRLRGRWRNELGAHAGFSRAELEDLCRRAFGSATDISDEYYETLYSHRRTTMKLILSTSLQRIVYPCVYVMGRRVDA